MNRDIIQKIIEAGNQAPSGGNSQPWKFVVRNNVIEVQGLPEKDHPVMNFKNRGTYVALGALMENIEIAARSFGYQPEFEISPVSVAIKITFGPLVRVEDNGLLNAILKRHSNRKFYSSSPINEKTKNYLLYEVSRFPECNLVVIEGEKINQVAKSLSVDILAFLQNQILHKSLFKEIIWNEEEQKTRGGLYIKTMEVAPPKSLMFRLLSNWKITQFFSKMKLPQKIYEESVKKTSASGLLCAIVISDADVNFFQAGRLLENMWLRATNQNLGFQLVSGTLFLWQQLNFGKQELFSRQDKEIINNAYEKLQEILGIKGKIISLIARIGEADAPLAVSYKRPAEIEWT